MPELRVRPRRGIDRQLVTEVEQDRPLEIVQKKDHATPALLGILGFVLLAYLTHPLWLTPSPQDMGPAIKIQGYSPTRRGVVAAPRRRGGLREFEGSSDRYRSAVAESMTKVRSVAEQVALVLPKVRTRPTAPATFKDRVAGFERLFTALPGPERRALFPDVDLERVRRLYDEKPEEACELIDKLFLRLRHLLP